MDATCNCPVCRFARGELTPVELAWICEAEIRTERNYLRLIREATNLHDLKESVKMNDVNVDENLAMLEELKHAHKVSDPAFDAVLERDELVQETTVALCKGKKALTDTGDTGKKAILG